MSFGCGRTGHQVSTCPDEGENAESDEAIRPQTSSEEMVELNSGLSSYIFNNIGFFSFLHLSHSY